MRLFAISTCESEVSFTTSRECAAPIPQVGTGWQLDGEANGFILAPPRLGADTEDTFLRWVGMSQPEIERLRSEQII